MKENLDPDSFAAHFEAATRQAGFTVEKRDGLDLHIVVHEGPMRCNLRTAYSAYLLSPHRLDDITQAHLDALGSVPPPPPRPTEKEAAESLLPLLNQAQWLKGMQKSGTLPLTHRPFVGDLVVTYVFDFPDHRAYLNKRILEQIVASPESTFDALHEHAVENLRKRTTKRDYKTRGLREKRVIICDAHDGYAATRILLPDLMETWAERIPGRMLIGIPNRDFLIAFSDRNRAHLAAIARQVRRDAARRDHPLCDELLAWRDGQVREYRPKH